MADLPWVPGPVHRVVQTYKEENERLKTKIEAALALLTDPLHKTYITPFELRQTMREAIKALTGGREKC